MRIGYNNFVLEMAAPEMRATCVALQNTLVASITLFPLIAGFLIDGTSFTVVFGVQAVLMAIGFYISFQILDPRHNEAGACVT